MMSSVESLVQSASEQQQQHGGSIIVRCYHYHVLFTKSIFLYKIKAIVYKTSARRSCCLAVPVAYRLLKLKL